MGFRLVVMSVDDFWEGLDERCGLMEEARGVFEKWVGEYDASGLWKWVERELDGGGKRRVLVPEKILAVVSGNTPHAAWQSVFRGLVLGAKTLVKLPGVGLEGFEEEVAGLPERLRELVETSRVLREDWEAEAGAWVVYGSDETVAFFRNRAPVGMPFASHGHRLGIGVVREVCAEAASAAVRDVCDFEQRGCLSLQTVFVEGSVDDFGEMLAEAFAANEVLDPAPELDLSTRGAVATLREEVRFRIANGVGGYGLWESEEGLAWTLVAWPKGELRPSPLGRTLYLQELPVEWGELGKLSAAVSGTGVFPFSRKEEFPGFRIFPLGEAQKPPFDWYQDGVAPLASLVRWQELG